MDIDILKDFIKPSEIEKTISVAKVISVNEGRIRLQTTGGLQVVIRDPDLIYEENDNVVLAREGQSNSFIIKKADNVLPSTINLIVNSGSN